MREQLVRACEIMPLEVIVRNYAAGTMAKRLGIEEGTQLPRPIVEYCYKDDALGDPLVTEEHIAAFGWASQQDMDDILSLALRVNDFLSGVMYGVGIKLVDFKIEIGRVYDGDFQRLIVADEISPDSCRLWDIETGQKAGQGRVPPRSGQPDGCLYRSGAAAGRDAQGRHADDQADADQLTDPGAAAALRDRKREDRAMKARVHVMLKNGVLDPQGEAVRHALGRAGV